MTAVLPDRPPARASRLRLPTQGEPTWAIPTQARLRTVEPVTQQLSTVFSEPVPGIVLDVDIAEPIPGIPPARAGRPVQTAWILVRAFTEPVGQSIVDIPPTGLTADLLAARIQRDFGVVIRERVVAAGGELAPGAPAGGARIGGTPPYLATRSALLADPLPITVVVCTRERPVQLRACLESLVDQVYPYPAYRILVVDNAPRTEATRAVVRDFQRRFHVDYLLESRPGLSRARNAAVAAAPGELLAFTDDDVVADRFWLAELARGFAEVPGADVLCGLILPAELETRAQVWFEEHWGCGRGFTPALLGRPADLLHPLPAPGTGANMAFRPGVLESLGGFDEALGPGTPSSAAEDILAVLQVLRGGGTVAYRPTALVRHKHHREVEDLRARLAGYGMGLTAACTGLVGRNPRMLRELIRALLAWSADRPSRAGRALPPELRGLVGAGALRGPAAYLRGRRLTRPW